MINLIKEFNKMGVAVRFLNDGISTEGEMGKRVVKFGRKPTIDRSKVLQMKAEGKSPTSISIEMKIGRSNAYKMIKATAIGKPV